MRFILTTGGGVGYKGAMLSFFLLLVHTENSYRDKKWQFKITLCPPRTEGAGAGVSASVGSPPGARPTPSDSCDS